MINYFDASFCRTFFNFSGRIGVLRLDLPDPITGGNKQYKLKYNLESFRNSGCDALLTFGGAYSNHIAATAAVSKRENIKVIGVIRGDELNQESNNVLQFASSSGMRLHFVSRSDYRRRFDPDFLESLKQKFGSVFIVPEGGSNEHAVRGCEEILSDATKSFDHIFLPVGTGGTIAGIIRKSKPHQCVHGIAVLNGRNYLESEVQRLCGEEAFIKNWQIHHEYAWGGYGKTGSRLKEFIQQIFIETQLPLDAVYSGKALYALKKIIEHPEFTGKDILFVHTGGYAFIPIQKQGKIH